MFDLIAFDYWFAQNSLNFHTQICTVEMKQSSKCQTIKDTALSITGLDKKKKYFGDASHTKNLVSGLL